MNDKPGARAGSPGAELEMAPELRGVLHGEGQLAGAEATGGVRETAGAAGGEVEIFRFGGVWHARRQILNGRLVMGIGYTKALAVADLESQWSMA